MARIRIQDENREITDSQDICEFLKPFGIWYEQWDVEGRVGPEATNEEILAAYAPEVERLKKAGGFVTADMINVTAETPNLDVMFPYVRKHLTFEVFASWLEPEYIEAFHAIARDAGHDSLDAWLKTNKLTRENPLRAADVVCKEVLRLMDADVKATGLKRLQG